MSVWNKTKKGKLVGNFKVEWWDGRAQHSLHTSEESADWKIDDLKKEGITASITERPRWVEDSA